MPNYKKIDEIFINAIDQYFNWLFNTFGLVGGILITIAELVVISIVTAEIINMVI